MISIFGWRLFSCGNGSINPSVQKLNPMAWCVTVPSNMFMAGDPINVATNRFRGLSYNSSGLPICSIFPCCIMTILSAIVMASIWS